MITTKRVFGLLLVLTVSFPVAARTQQHQHDHRVEGINKRGDHAMGFSHEKTIHHFRISASGGAIEVTARERTDTVSQEQIKAHLSHIAKLFKEGDFSKPMFTHGETPPGVPTMKRLKAEIDYTFEEIENGARVRISSVSPEAIKALHQFLRYQIKEHQTGDSLEPDKR